MNGKFRCLDAFRCARSPFARNGNAHAHGLQAETESISTPTNQFALCHGNIVEFCGELIVWVSPEEKVCAHEEQIVPIESNISHLLLVDD